MKRIYFIIGEGSVGKSTLVRCLTGINRAKRLDLRFTGGLDVVMWAWMRSMQELNPQKSPNDLLAEITSPDDAEYEYYLIPLRMYAMYGYQSAQAYIDLLTLHCIIMGAVVLSRDTVEPQLTLPVPQISIPNSHALPANVNADTVRTAWGWI